MADYKCFVISNFMDESNIDKRLAEFSEAGYVLLPTTIRGNILIFQKSEELYLDFDTDKDISGGM